MDLHYTRQVTWVTLKIYAKEICMKRRNSLCTMKKKLGIKAAEMDRDTEMEIKVTER
jgi:hypothetical protein